MITGMDVLTVVVVAVLDVVVTMRAKTTVWQTPNGSSDRGAIPTTLVRRDENASTFVLFHQYNFV